MRYLIGIDDTDNLESRGTGHRVRQLATALNEARLARTVCITRHQLLVSPLIPYTSHNSSACMRIETDQPEAVWFFCKDFLVRESADGSDAGLCLALEGETAKCVIAFGTRAKIVVLTQLEAEETAERCNVRMEGLTGTGGGVIGALAAIGLHAQGNDGRILWMPGLRELQGTYTVADLRAAVSIDRVCDLQDNDLPETARINVGEWLRPLMRAGKTVLLVEEAENDWRIIAKDRIKALSA